MKRPSNSPEHNKRIVAERLSDMVQDEGNAWAGEDTGEKGYSKIVDIRNMSHVSIAGVAIEHTQLVTWVSGNGADFYYASEIPIIEPEPAPSDNVAFYGEGFSTPNTTTDGDIENLAEEHLMEDEWETHDDSPIIIDINLPDEINLVAYEIAPVSGGRFFPTAWDLEADDAGSWTTLDSETAVAGDWDGLTLSSYTLDYVGAYDHYRFSMSYEDTSLRLAQIRLLAEVDDEQLIEPLYFHYAGETVGARYIRLQSIEDVFITASIWAKP